MYLRNMLSLPKLSASKPTLQRHVFTAATARTRQWTESQILCHHYRIAKMLPIKETMGDFTQTVGWRGWEETKTLSVRQKRSGSLPFRGKKGNSMMSENHQYSKKILVKFIRDIKICDLSMEGFCPPCA